MRSLAYDLGRRLGCGGHLSSLTRLRSGPFRLEDAIGVDEAESRFEDGTWRECVHAPDVVVGKMRAAIVGRQAEDRLRHGRPLSDSLRMPFVGPDEQCRVYSTDGRFLAIISFDASASDWRPQRVLQPGLRHRAGRVARSAAAQAATGPPSEGASEGLIAPSPLTGED